MTRQANAAALIGTYTAPRASSEAEMCPGKCGDVVRFFVGFGGHLEVAPCSTCARLAGKPDPGVPRRTVADADRDLADVLLFFTTTWREGTSRLQRKRLAAKVQWLLARVQLPELDPPAHLVPRPVKTPRPQKLPGERTSTSYVKTPAREEGARRGGVTQGMREHHCSCGRVTRGNVAWGMHRKFCAVARSEAPDPAALRTEAAE